jgi:tripartite-type tricarboxylate transporter receptor subunit TctC
VRNRAIARGAFLLTIGTVIGVVPFAASIAQTYPDRPIRLVVPFAAGATNDSIGRLIADSLSPRLGRPIVVENRPGAGTQIGMEFVMNAPADGYTLVVGSVDGLGALPVMKKKPPFDPIADFTPVGRVAVAPLAFAVASSFAPNTMAELVAYAKSRPGSIRYGSPGPGTVLHLGLEWLQSMAGIEMTHVPYRGGAPMMQGVVAADVELVLTSADFASTFMEAGKLKILAQADRKRHVLLPDVPTTAEAGFPDLQVVAWFGVLGPRGMEQSIVNRLTSELEIILKDQDLGARLEKVGASAAYLPPNDFSKFIAEERKKWGTIVDNAKIPLQD